MSQPQSILVVGGGVAGMCAAIMLGRAGHTVRLVDADKNWLALGAGMTLNGGAWRAFKQMGILDDVKEAGAAGTGTKTFTADGTMLSDNGFGEPFGPGVPVIGGIMRPALHGILQKATRAAGVTVELGKRVVGIVTDDTSATVDFESGDQERFDIVIGADGVNSVVKSVLFPEAPALEYSGQGCWRAVVKRPADINGPVVFYGRQKCGINPVSKDEMYLFHLNNLPEKRYIPSEEWVDLLRAELAEYSAPLVREISDSLGPSSLVHFTSLDAGMTPKPWYKGRALLIGDAAHATTPHNAYGAGLGIEDGIAIAEELEREGTVQEAFERFVERRFDRCRAVVEGSVHQCKLEQKGASLQEFGQSVAAVAKVIMQPF